jgi:hypothetical protein
MLKDRFEPIDPDSLSLKAEDLSCKNDVLVGLDDDVPMVQATEEVCEETPTWKSRIAQVLPVVKALKDTDK